MSVKSAKSMFFLIRPRNFGPAPSPPQITEFALVPNRDTTTAHATDGLSKHHGRLAGPIIHSAPSYYCECAPMSNL